MHPDPANGKLGLMHGHGGLTFTGDLLETSHRVWLSVEHPDGWLATAGTRVDIIQFAGTVAGCGDGIMIVLGTAGFRPGTATREDLLHAVYMWQILPGFGTGALATATGAGGRSTDENNTSGSAALTGTIHCGA